MSNNRVIQFQKKQRSSRWSVVKIIPIPANRNDEIHARDKSERHRVMMDENHMTALPAKRDPVCYTLLQENYTA